MAEQLLSGKSEAALEQDRYRNKQAVMLKSGGLYLPKGAPTEMGKFEAMVFAAWIVRMVDHTGGEAFAQVLRQVRGRSS